MKKLISIIFLIFLFCIVKTKPAYAAIENCSFILPTTEFVPGNQINGIVNMSVNKCLAALDTTLFKFKVHLEDNNGNEIDSTSLIRVSCKDINDGDGNFNKNFSLTVPPDEGSYRLYIIENGNIKCSSNIQVSLTASPAPSLDPDATGKIIKLLQPSCCNTKTNNDADCSAVGQLHIGIRTALGCFPTRPEDMISWFLGFAIMFAGAAAFLLMIFGAFQIIMSSGDPEKIKKGQELLTAAVAGLILIIFAVFILRFIGVTILAIPGWS